MGEVVRASVGVIDKHREMMLEAFPRWCPVTNTFFTGYGEVGITLWEFLIISG